MGVLFIYLLPFVSLPSSVTCRPVPIQVGDLCERQVALLPQLQRAGGLSRHEGPPPEAAGLRHPAGTTPAALIILMLMLRDPDMSCDVVQLPYHELEKLNGIEEVKTYLRAKLYDIPP